MMTRMRFFAVVCACTVAASLAAAQAPSYSRFFTGDTMRVDYLHTGGPGGEALTLDQVVHEGAWPGSRSRPVDDTNLGDYYFDVADRDTDRVIYSRGFGSVYGEWVTTPEVASVRRTFEESLRFPWPRAAIRITLKRRDADNVFQSFWSIEVDPRHQAVKSLPRPSGRIWTLFESGPPRTKVDLLLLSDGYTTEQLPKFHADAARLTAALFAYEPFKSRRGDFNVRGLDLPSEQSPINAEYNIFGLARYVLTYKNRALRDAAAAAPYDVLEILVNSAQYGGGGIFNLQSTAAADGPRADYVFVHELAHNLAGLGDEYVGNVTYQTGRPDRPEPWEPNLTALRDPALLKWKDLVDPSTPIPTPADDAGRVGAFEGGGYEPRGLFRPEFECIMGTTRPGVGFCRVCQRAIGRAVAMLSEP
jgi:IgA Peptidase M64/Peptidase M64 N-terminus